MSILVAEKLRAYQCGTCAALYIINLTKCSNCGYLESLTEFVADNLQFEEALLGSLRYASESGLPSLFVELWSEYVAKRIEGVQFDSLLQEVRASALRKIRGMLEGGDLASAVHYYLDSTDLLISLDALAENERAQLIAALKMVEKTGVTFLQRAIFLEDDEQISKVFQTYMVAFGCKSLLTARERARVALADQRLEALRDLRNAFRSQDTHQALELYTRHKNLLLGCRNFGVEERQQIENLLLSDSVNSLRWAIKKGEIPQIIDFGRRAVLTGYRLTPHEREAVNVARELAARLEALRKAIDSSDDIGIVLAGYGDWIETCPDISKADRQRIKAAELRVQRGIHD